MPAVQRRVGKRRASDAGSANGAADAASAVQARRQGSKTPTPRRSPRGRRSPSTPRDRTSRSPRSRSSTAFGAALDDKAVAAAKSGGIKDAASAAPTSSSASTVLTAIVAAAAFVGGQAAVMIIGQGLRARGVQAMTLISLMPIYLGLFVIGTWNKLRSAAAARAHTGTGGAAASAAAAVVVRPTPWALLIVAGVVHFVGFVSMSAAIGAAGPALFSVVFASQPLMTGFLAAAVLGAHLAAVQWAAFFVMVGGLIAATFAASPGAQVVGGDVGQVVVGFSLSLASTLLLALSSIVSESALTGVPMRLPCATRSAADAKPLPGKVDVSAVQIGRAVQGLVMACVVWATYSFPRWDALFSDPVGAVALQRGVPAGDVAWEVGQLALLTAVATLAMSGGYFALATVPGGSVLVAALSPGSSVLVAVLSHLMFCGDDAKQCTTPTKAAASAVVLAGVLMFVLARK